MRLLYEWGKQLDIFTWLLVLTTAVSFYSRIRNWLKRQWYGKEIVARVIIFVAIIPSMLLVHKLLTEMIGNAFGAAVFMALAAFIGGYVMWPQYKPESDDQFDFPNEISHPGVKTN